MPDIKIDTAKNILRMAREIDIGNVVAGTGNYILRVRASLPNSIEEAIKNQTLIKINKTWVIIIANAHKKQFPEQHKSVEQQAKNSSGDDNIAIMKEIFNTITDDNLSSLNEKIIEIDNKVIHVYANFNQFNIELKKMMTVINNHHKQIDKLEKAFDEKMKKLMISSLVIIISVIIAMSVI